MLIFGKETFWNHFDKETLVRLSLCMNRSYFNSMLNVRNSFPFTMSLKENKFEYFYSSTRSLSGNEMFHIHAKRHFVNWKMRTLPINPK